MASTQPGQSAVSGKNVLVTGGASGIGAAVCRFFANHGARVVVADLNAPAAAEVAASLPGAVAAALDVSDSRAVESLVGEQEQIGAGLDVVVHCAGVDDPVLKEALTTQLGAGGPLNVTPDVSDEQWNRVLRINLDGTFYVLRAALRAMASHGRGAIVVIGSSAAFDAPAGYAHYSASKAGVHALAQSVAKEAISLGVRINVVAPGPTDTPMNNRTSAVAAQGSAPSPTSRAIASPSEIASVVGFLAGDDAVNMVGAVLLANGGRFTA